MSDGIVILCVLSPIIIPLIGFCMMIYFSFKNEGKQIDLEREQAIADQLEERAKVMKYRAELESAKNDGGAKSDK